MAQVSIPLIQGANSTNNVRDAFDSRTAQIDQQRAQEEKQRDQDFHTVVKYASDGLTNEAKYFAQQKGINVPEEVFRNADFAKGLAIAGDLYDDPVAAQKFTTAYVSTQGDRMARYNTALAAGGKPLGKDDRELNLYAKKLQLQQQYGGSGADRGFSLSPGQTRYDANGNVVAAAPDSTSDFDIWNKTYNASISSGLKSEDEARAAADAAVSQKKQMQTSQPQNPYAGRGNPAINIPVDQIPPVLMDGNGNMSAPQQGQGQLTPPNSPQIQQQTKTNIPQDYKIIGKTHDGFDLYQSPDGRQFYDDGKPDVQYGSVQTTNTVNDELSSPAMVAYSPQQQIPRSPVMKLTPVSSQNDALNPVEYASVPQRGSLVDYAKTGLYNATNIPAHLYGIGRVSAGLLSGAESIGQGAMQGVDNLMDGVEDYINRPSQVIVYDKQGNGFYVPVEHLQKAINMGYSTSIEDGPKVPISQ